jgi:hypothetical protein
MPMLVLVLLGLTDIDNDRRVTRIEPDFEVRSRNLADRAQLIQVRKLERIVVNCRLIGLQRFLNLVR